MTLPVVFTRSDFLSSSMWSTSMPWRIMMTVLSSPNPRDVDSHDWSVVGLNNVWSSDCGLDVTEWY